MATDKQPPGVVATSRILTARLGLMPALPMFVAVPACLFVPGVGLLLLGSRRLALRAALWIVVSFVVYFIGALIYTISYCGDGLPACGASDVPHLTAPIRIAQWGTALWVLWAAFRVGMQRMVRKRYALCELAEADLPSCPRCRAAERTTSGWCPSCSATLRACVIEVDHPLVLAADMHAGHCPPVPSRLDPRYRVNFSSGESVRVRPAGVRFMPPSRAVCIAIST